MLNSPIDEIKQRLDIVDVLSEYLQLKKAGGNYKANCPFHHEKTPSLMISPDKQIWHCFGCGKGGDIFAFIQEIEGMDFPEALRVLAKKANVTLSYQDPALTSKKTKVLDILKISADWLQKQLQENPQAEIARQYILQRKVSLDAQEDFKLGYSLGEWSALNDFLKTKGYSEEDIFTAGMTVKKDKGTGYFDRFRGRLMFPIRDVHGSIVGFTARLLKEDPDHPAGKYVNTPQTMVYDKSSVIYGLDRAKQEIKKSGAAIIVEGNMDVITCHQAGFKNVVASSGTALTEKQLQLLKRYSPNIIMSFDMDAAGQDAAKRGIEIAWQLEMNIKVLTLPAEFKDPDECIKKDPQIFQVAINNAQNIMDYYFASAIKDKDIKKVEDKKSIAAILLPMIAKISESIEQTHYLQKLSSLINVPEDVLREKIKKNIKISKNIQSQHDTSLNNSAIHDRFAQLSERIVALALLHNEDFKYFADYLEPDYLTDENIKNLYKKFIQFYNQTGTFSVDNFLINNPDTQRQIDVVYLLAEKEFGHLDEKAQQKELINSLKILEKNYICIRTKQIEQEIKSAEASNNKELVANLLQEFNLLMQKLTQL